MDSTLPSGSVSQNASRKQITKFEQAEYVHRQLLYDLMSSIYEFILILTSNAPNSCDDVTAVGLKASASQAANDYHHTPNVESLLIHIHSCLEQIFLNGLRILKPDVSIFMACLFVTFYESIASSDLHSNETKRKKRNKYVISE